MRRYSPPIVKLSDRFGDYQICVTCRKCQHSRTTDPHVFARMFGWEATLESVAKRLRCSKCEAKDCDMKTLGPQPRPRGTPKNPH